MKKRHSVTHQRFQFDSLDLDSDSEIPMFRQLEEQLRLAIWQGLLGSGERLPSSRGLATQLGVARNTVINAYDQLLMEGFLETVKGSGTRVAKHLPKLIPAKGHRATLMAVDADPNLRLTKRFLQVRDFFNIPLGDSSPLRPFRAHTPTYREFPKKQWAQLATKRLRQQNNNWMERIDPNGYWPLRQAIAGHLGAARGLNVDAENIMISAGAQQAIDLLAKLLIEPGDVVCFEEPCYTPAAAVFQMAGAKIITIPVDDEGINVESLKATVKKAKLIYVTPSSHFPLSMTMSQARRQDLLEWARSSGAIIIEDDYNGEYRYRGRPLPTLYAMAEQGLVIYLGSFSKLLFPALRLGYMVVPQDLMTPLAQLRWLLDRHSPSLEQMVLTDFINQGFFARHLRRMRTLYAERQKVLAIAAEKHLGDYLDMPLLDGGLHLIGWLKSTIAEEDFLTACEKADVEVMPVSLFTSMPTENQGIIFGYAPYAEDEVNKYLMLLKRTLEGLF